MQRKKRQLYSEEFKKEKVRMMESGEVRKVDLVKMYGMSYPTLYKWLKKYGTLPARESVVLEKDSEYKKKKELRVQIEKMERVIGRQQMELDYYKEVVKQATGHFQIDIEKKFNTK